MQQIILPKLRLIETNMVFNFLHWHIIWLMIFSINISEFFYTVFFYFNIYIFFPGDTASSSWKIHSAPAISRAKGADFVDGLPLLRYAISAAITVKGIISDGEGVELVECLSKNASSVAAIICRSYPKNNNRKIIYYVLKFHQIENSVKSITICAWERDYGGGWWRTWRSPW